MTEIYLVLVEDTLLSGAHPPRELLLALRRQVETAALLLSLGLDDPLVAPVGGEAHRKRRPIVGREGAPGGHLPAGYEKGAQRANLLFRNGGSSESFMSVSAHWGEIFSWR